MRKIKNSKFKVLFFILLALLILSGCSSRQSSNRTIEQSESDVNTILNVVLQFDFGNDKIKEEFIVDATTGESLWPVMKRTLEINNINIKYQDYGSDLGVLIIQIGDKKNGQNRKYWQYFINDKYAQVGASSYILQADDVIEWKFTNDSF